MRAKGALVVRRGGVDAHHEQPVATVDRHAQFVAEQFGDAVTCDVVRTKVRLADLLKPKLPERPPTPIACGLSSKRVITTNWRGASRLS